MNQTPEDRLRIFDRQGFSLAEFRVNVERSWAIGYEGRATFSYPTRKTDVVNEKVLQFGNYLLVESTTLPPWIGVIDTPRAWADKEVEVNAFTPERLFSYRRGGIENKLTGSAGSIFAQLIDIINLAEPTILQAGSIWRGGSQREETVTPDTIEKNLKQLQSRSQEEYSFDPQILNNRLAILANWTDKLGEETPLVLQAANYGGNVETPTMTEDDEIMNDVLGYGDGITWSSRIVANITDLQSIQKYGLRQSGQEWRGVSRLETIEANNYDIIYRKRKPRRIFRLTALNIGSTFDYIRLGNICTLQLQSMGFDRNGTDTIIRILGMSYNPQYKNKIKLITEEKI